nr:hypothetical protein [Nitrospinaceae bacterium]NIR57183.1 hypothetical protein [Nitrospinaceae bacterium]NIS87625.1 hypothetical protein [Nitrospinaceae bacterium]NIT85174.1 hypothetical protein [Nitrospinaceae bacterium]NIU46682.1 hypothetical protein [Nitrospinaceae bacterium]
MNEDFKTILARLGIPSAPPERREKKKGAAASNGRRKEADLWSRPDFIRCLQAHRESGDAEASPEAYFFAIARSLIFEADDRWPEV